MNFLNRIKIQTPESVELEFSLAGIGNRAQALFVDYVYWLLTLLLLIVLGLWFAFSWLDFLQDATGDSSLALWYYAILGLIFFFVYMGYFVFFETLWQGQTPGKRRAKIRVICDDGRPVGLPQATLRALLRPVDDLFFLGALMIMLSKREKRLGDWIAGTLVVQDEQARTAADFPVAEQAREFGDRLLQTADLSALPPDDFAAIREYLQRRSDLLPDAKKQISLQLARNARECLAIAQIPKGITADLFLEAVYWAYQQR
ncbi:MAG: RDD family protein [Cyanobacteriota bacterium]|nr:RDD family protein [Cyanobacteriota bacterium]